MYEPKSILLPLASGTIIFIVLSFFIQKSLPSFIKTSDKPVVTVGETKVSVDIVHTPQKRQIGLSGRKKLGKNEGMLFVFEDADTRPAFWMEGMLFPIDIIWINDGEISQLHLDVPPPEPDTSTSELPFYQPYVGIDYVLEVNAGFVKQQGIAVGDTVDLSQIEKIN